MARGRKRTIIGDKIVDLYNDAKNLRESAKRLIDDVEPLRRLEAFAVALDMPLPEKIHNISKCSWGWCLDYDNENHRAQLGKIFNITTWPRHVCEYSGSVSLRADVETPLGRMLITLGNAALAKGCRIEEVKETYTAERTRYRSVCDETNTELAS